MSPARVLVLYLAVLLPLSTLVAKTVTANESDYQAQIEANQQRLQALSKAVKQAEQQRTELLGRIRQQQAKVAERGERVASLAVDIGDWEQRLDTLEETTQVARQRLSGAQHHLANLVRATLQVKKNNPWQVILQHQDPAEAARIGTWYNYILRAQHDQITQATAAIGTLEDANHEALKSRNWLQYLRKKATEQQATHQALASQTNDRISGIDSEISSNRKEVRNLKADQERLAALLEELRKRSLGASGYFSAGKGKYPFPTPGKIAIRFGDTKSVGRLTWTGTVIQASRGQKVRTIADGEVVYADFLQGFGMLLVIDHGDGFMTLYGANSKLLVAKGDWVETGATVSLVGRLEGQAQDGLYFEVRHNARPTDPAAWIGSKNRFPAADS